MAGVTFNTHATCTASVAAFNPPARRHNLMNIDDTARTPTRHTDTLPFSMAYIGERGYR